MINYRNTINTLNKIIECIFNANVTNKSIKVTDIAKELDMTWGSISNHIVMLNEKNIITCTIIKSDKRSKLIELTAKGIELYF